MRDRQKLQLKNEQFDLVVIGGGITGAGIALDAASRGIKTALVDMGDFASGTSSKSTKLIHGGLRYLKQLDLKLVRESGRERAIVHRNARHLCIPNKLILPIYKKGGLSLFSTRIALWFYDILIGSRKEEKKVMLSRQELLKQIPLLNKHGLLGGAAYYEYKTEDARLTIEVIKTAIRQGACCINYVKAVGFNLKDGKIRGVKLKDQISSEDFEVKANYVISAAGPWVDKLRNINKEFEDKKLALTKGIHLVFDNSRFKLPNPVYIDALDGRMIFAIPYRNKTYVGTTDTIYSSSKLRIRSTNKDVLYLLDSINDKFPGLGLSPSDIISSWAGLRPLIYQKGKSPSELSRRDEIFEESNGLLSIAGGKLTGYRKMAERIVDLVASKMTHDGAVFTSCQTQEMALVEHAFNSNKELEDYKLDLLFKLEGLGRDDPMAEYLIDNYGKQSSDILLRIEHAESENMAQKLLEAELDFCLQNEMIVKVSDFLVRRTGRLYYDIESVVQNKEFVIELMSKKCNWTNDRKNSELEELNQLIHDSIHFENVE